MRIYLIIQYLKIHEEDSKIFVAGHNGMVGKAIVKSLIQNGYKNILVEERKNLDLCDFQKVKYYFENKNQITFFMQQEK